MFRKSYVLGQIAFVFLFSSIAFGQTSEIKGKVIDQRGAAVSGANVTARDKTNGREVKVQTDSSGVFVFENLSGSNYIVKVEAAGFSFSSKEVSLKDANAKNLEMRLLVGNISEDVTVTATRTQVATTDTAVSVSVVGRQEIERNKVNTIGDVFRNLPGMSTVNEGSFQVRPRIRGLDSNRVLILVDGERLNNGRTSTAQSGIEIGLVGTEQIETLEVVRGNGSVLYGTDALGGIINIITKDAPRRTNDGFRYGATFNGFYSSNDKARRGNVGLTGSSKFFSFRVAQSLERSNNYFSGDTLGNTSNEVLNSQSHGSNTQATTRFFFNEDNDLRLNYERRRAGNIGVPTLVGAFNAFFPFSNRDKFSSRFETRNINNFLAKISASFYYQKQDRNFSNILTVPAVLPFFPGLNNFSETITDTSTYGFDVQSNWVLGSKNFLTAGASFFRDENEDSRLTERRIPVVTQDRSTSVPDAFFGSFAAFAQDEFEVHKRLKLIGGIRIERFSSGSSATNGFALPATLTAGQLEDLKVAGLNQGLNVSNTSVTGDLGVVFRLTDDVSLTGRLGRSYRAPNLFERFFTGGGSVGGFVVGNPNLNPETGINFDASVKVRTDKYAGSVTYFNNYYRDFLSNQQSFDRNDNAITIPGGRRPIDVFQTINIGRARIQGFEAEIEVPIKLGLGFLTPNGSISYLRGDNLETNQPLNTITPLKTVLNVRWTNLLANYYVDWTTRIINKQSRLSQSFLTANFGPEAGFAVSDIGGGYTFKRPTYRFSVNVGVKNLFDRFYAEQFVNAPARGRSFVIGTTLEIFSKK